MPTVNPSPWGPKPQIELADGLPAVGGLLFFYVGGSVNTKQDTYTDSTGNTANSNPIVLNSLGFPPNEIWFAEGLLYKVVYAPANDTDPPTSPIWTVDNVRGQNDTSITIDQWVASGLTPTYISATSFSLVGDQTTAFHVGRRLKSTNSGGTIYSYINASVFGAVTTVTVVNDSGVLDAGLSAVSYGLLTATNPSTPLLPDTRPIASGLTDRTKKVRLEVDGITTDTTRVMTVVDEDVTLVNSGKAYVRNGADTAVATFDVDLSNAVSPTGWSTPSKKIVSIRGIIASNDGVGIDLRVSTDGGATFLSGASDYGWTRMGVNTGSVAGLSDEADSEINLISGVGNAGFEDVNIEVEIAKGGAGGAHVSWKATYATSTPVQNLTFGYGRLIASGDAITDIRLLVTAGTFTSFVYTVFLERA